MIVLYIITGLVLGVALFASIYYMGYKDGYRAYEEL